MIGNIFITIALLAAIFSTVMYYFTLKGYSNTINKARIGYHLMSIMVISASILLLYAILTHQYQFKYVYEYSNSDLPTGLLASTFYAGQEGSFLLWGLFSAIIGLILLDYTSKRGDLEQRVMLIYSFINVMLLIMISPLLKSPFTYIWQEGGAYIDIKSINPNLLNLSFIGNFIFQDQAGQKQFFLINSDTYALLLNNGISLNDFIIHGKGLNPLLQNFWMQIHPPMLFIGFAMAAVPYSFAIAALIKNEYNDWVKQSFPWVLFGHMILGLAIMLGGYWAYGVLGWGGYWGWDPVENSSLVPWLIGVASIHTFIVQKRTQEQYDGKGRFVKTNLILSILTFAFVIYSTFLTRSGVLSDASVHSFVAPGRIVFLFLLINVILFAGIGIGAVAFRWKYLNEHFNFEENILSRELALFTGAATLIASGLIIIFGTSLPIFGKGVDISFYNKSHLPIAIIVGILMGFSLLLRWKTTDKKDLFDNAKYSLIATFVLSVIVILLGKVYNFMTALFTVTTIFALVLNAEFLFKTFKRNLLHAGAFVAHIGIAVFMLGVIATGSFTIKKSVDLPQNETVNVLGYNLVFTGYEPIENNTKYAFNVEIASGENKTVAKPVMYIAEFNNSLMREPDILNFITKDFYLEPLGYNEGNSAGNGAVLLKKNEPFEYEGRKITFTGFNFPNDAMQKMSEGSEFTIGAVFTVVYNGIISQGEALMRSKGGEKDFIPVDLKDADLRIEMTNLDASGTVSVKLSKLSDPNPMFFEASPTLSVEVSIKPFINLVWLGVILMVIGFIIAALKRVKQD
jgi:cytochrome c-type biogenesis protein CcmF